MGKAGKGIERFFVYVLVVLVVLGMVGGISYLFLRDEGITYYVEYNGQRFLANTGNGNLWLSSDACHSFGVKSLVGESVNYSVSVQTNKTNNFSFSCDGENYEFYSAEKEYNEYSEVFELQKTTDSFSITIPKGFTVEKAVCAKYGNDIELHEKLLDDLPYFAIVVTVDESRVVLMIGFNGQAVIPVQEIEIDNSSAII